MEQGGFSISSEDGLVLAAYSTRQPQSPDKPHRMSILYRESPKKSPKSQYRKFPLPKSHTEGPGEKAKQLFPLPQEERASFAGGRWG